MNININKKTRSDNGRERVVVLVGNPNVGKSVIFGALTGRYATVSNYPGTTVDVSKGTAWIRRHRCRIIDSPGVNSLVPTSEDERVTRDILLNEDIDEVIHVVDSKNLRRGLFVTLQLLEMGIAPVIALNMYDEAGERGIEINRTLLSKRLGLEVVPTIATQRWNLDKLKSACFNKRSPLLDVTYPEAVEEGVRKIASLLPEARISKRSIALMLLSKDATIRGWLAGHIDTDTLKNIDAVVHAVESRFAEPIGTVINRTRLRYVDRLVRDVVRTKPGGRGRIASFIGRWSMHPVAGIPILVFILFLMYEFVGVLGAGVSVDLIERYVFGAYINPWAQRVVDYIVPWPFFRDLLVGPYGLITMALTYAIAIVLPIVSFFFIFFSILEDSGYLPRLALMVDRVFKFIGLNGKAVLPMVLGLGCDTMATMTTRILETKKERIIVTLLLALGVPCSAQLGVILGMLGSVSFKATLWWGGVVVGVMLFVGYLSSKIIPGETSDFLIEIPPVRLPQLSNVLLKTLVKVEWYLKEAVPLFILGTLFLFVLDKSGLLLKLERWLSPVIVDFMDLPARTTEAFIVGFLRRDYGAAGLLNLQRQGLLDPVQVVVSLVTITLFVPCIANFFMIIKERGMKTALAIAAVIFPLAIIVGGALNAVMRSLGVTL